jgi:hypothetical protein
MALFAMNSDPSQRGEGVFRSLLSLPRLQEEAVFAAVSSWHSRNCCHSSWVFIIKISLNSELQPQWIHKKKHLSASCSQATTFHDILMPRRKRREPSSEQTPDLCGPIGPVRWGSGVGAMARACPCPVKSESKGAKHDQSTIKSIKQFHRQFHILNWIILKQPDSIICSVSSQYKIFGASEHEQAWKLSCSERSKRMQTRAFQLDCSFCPEWTFGLVVAPVTMRQCLNLGSFGRWLCNRRKHTESNWVGFSYSAVRFVCFDIFKFQIYEFRDPIQAKKQETIVKYNKQQQPKNIKTRTKTIIDIELKTKQANTQNQT